MEPLPRAAGAAGPLPLAMAPSSTNWLAVLGLTPGATADEIKEAHRDLTKVWHPDRFGHDPRLRRKAEERLKQINVAYEALTSSARAAQASMPRPGAAPGSQSPLHPASSVTQRGPTAPVRHRPVRMPLPYVDVTFGNRIGQLVDLSLTGGQLLLDRAPVVGTVTRMVLRASGETLELTSRVIRVGAAIAPPAAIRECWAVSVAFVDVSPRDQHAIPHFYKLLLDDSRHK